jgi:hypothetical protein
MLSHTDAGLALYDNISGGKQLIWCNGVDAEYTVMQSNSNLVSFASNGDVLWKSINYVTDNAYLEVLNTGNIVIRQLLGGTTYDVWDSAMKEYVLPVVDVASESYLQLSMLRHGVLIKVSET